MYCELIVKSKAIFCILLKLEIAPAMVASTEKK